MIPRGPIPHATVSALKSLEGGIILIAGGQDRGLDFSELSGVILNKVKTLIVMGENKKEAGRKCIKPWI